MILVVDNFDSFVWNIVQDLRAISEPAGVEVRIERNDAPLEELLGRAPRAVVLSPGPGRPEDSGVCAALLAALPREVPLLGVCLGHQVLCMVEGGVVARDPAPVHGRASRARHDGSELFAGLPDPFDAGRYHSLHAQRPLPRTLVETAWLEDERGARGAVMAVRHRELPRFGVQFHPESILTPDGGRLLEAFLALAGVRGTTAPRF